MRINCCLNLPPPTSNQSSLIPTKPPHVLLVKNEGCWRRQCVMMGVASYFTIIGLEIDNLLVHQEAVSVAVSKEIMTKPLDIVTKNSYSSFLVSGAKWSEKRACPSWRGNSLETIVPENLPRPAARRRYETVRSTNKDAPPLSLQQPLKHRTNKGTCFSM